MIGALLAVARRFIGRGWPAGLGVPVAPVAPPAHDPPAFCRKPLRECSKPFCTCQNAAMVEGAMPPVRHRELYADRFEVEGKSFTDS